MLKLGAGGSVVAVVIAMLAQGIFGVDAGQVLDQLPQGQQAAPPAGQEDLVSFVSFVLDDAQSTWQQKFAERGMQYRPANLVLFTDVVQSGCGTTGSETGPFYCPNDEKAYIDLGFYDELRRRFGAPGDFAQAYVLAHEIGHHVQHLLGNDRAVHEASSGNRNAMSVRLELQADCYAGVWAASSKQRNLLEPGDAEEAISAASAIGDDRLTGGRVSPDSFTHGTSAQRVNWFRRGLSSGSIDACNTFDEMAGL